MQARDFFLLYNKLTENCFTNCTDNFFSRNLSQDEVPNSKINNLFFYHKFSTQTFLFQLSCVDRCVNKFSRINQKIMQVYVNVQAQINQRRMENIKQMQATELAQQQINTSTADIIN